MSPETRFRPLLALAALLLAAGPAHAVVTGQCVQARGGNSCTANDVTFVLVGLGNQTDGCVSSSDTVTLNLGAKISNTTAQTRYDIGMYIYDFTGTEPAGNPPAAVGYAYNGSDCARETLKPVGTASPAETCTTTPALDLTTGNGPFLNADNNSDLCGDLLKSTTCGDSFIVFTDPITVKCSDGLGGTAADGFVDIPTCATWGNSANEVPTNGTNCGATNATHPETDVLPGTGSKCNCSNINSNIPAPNLSLSCSCSPTTVRTGASNGASTACTVTFTNNVSCTPNASTAERFRCGAASFLQFDMVANTPNNSFIFGQTQGNAPTETTGGTVDLSTTGTVRWTPRDTVATGGGTGLGILGHNETGTLSFQYYLDPAVPNGTTVNFTTTAYWSSSSSFSPRTAQSALTTTCSITASSAATWARISSLAARDEDGRVFVEWESAAEVGTVAFEVERLDPASGRFVKVVERPVPALAQLPGGRYRLLDATAPRGRELTYRVVEVDQQGRREILGPYRVAVTGAARRPADAGGAELTVRDKGLSPRLAAAVRQRATKSAQTAAAVSAPTAAARLKLLVSRSGMVRVHASDLAAGLGLRPDQLAGLLRAARRRLSHCGQDVAWQPAADGDGLVFYGEAIHGPYTDVNVYWLESGKGPLLAALAAQPATGPAATTFLDTLH